jgi:hypothetical protein
LAEGLPKQIQGSWIVDQANTIAQLKERPGWTENTERMLPQLRTMLGSMTFIFDESTFTQVMGSQRNTYPATLISSQKGVYTIEFTMSNRKQWMKLTLSKEGTLCLQSEHTTQMQKWVWKRIPPQNIE